MPNFVILHPSLVSPPGGWPDRWVGQCANFGRKVAIHHISRLSFCFSTFFLFSTISFFRFRKHRTLWEWKFQNATPPTKCYSSHNYVFFNPKSLMTALTKVACFFYCICLSFCGPTSGTGGLLQQPYLDVLLFDRFQFLIFEYSPKLGQERSHSHLLTPLLLLGNRNVAWGISYVSCRYHLSLINTHILFKLWHWYLLSFLQMFRPSTVAIVVSAALKEDLITCSDFY